VRGQQQHGRRQQEVGQLLPAPVAEDAHAPVLALDVRVEARDGPRVAPGAVVVVVVKVVMAVVVREESRVAAGAEFSPAVVLFFGGGGGNDEGVDM
jgi:hypothetical protein